MTKTRLGLHSHLNTKGRGIITQFCELLEINNSFGHPLSFADLAIYKYIQIKEYVNTLAALVTRAQQDSFVQSMSHWPSR